MPADELLDYRVLAGLAAAVLALPLFSRGLAGGGGVFLAPVVALPLSVLGGTLAGYGLADVALQGRHRALRLGVAVLSGGLGVTGPVVLWYVHGPGDASDLEWAYNTYALALGGAALVVLAREAALAAGRRGRTDA